jgi:hypothetical protein
VTFHIYVKPDGFPDISEHLLVLDGFPGYVYLGEVAAKPDIDGKRYVNGSWVWGGSEPESVIRRRRAYPPTSALIEALWQAMEEGTLPKVRGFYDEIAEAKKRFP